MSTQSPHQFPLLFSEGDIGRRKVKNRIVSTAHASAKDQDGLITEDLIRYHTRKAKGGTGLVMTFGSASVHERSAAAYGHINLWDDRNQSPLEQLAHCVHQHGSLVVSQATHMGHRANSRSTSGWPCQAPSGIPDEIHREIPHVLDISEIKSIVEGFANAARRLEACGWDGIELTSFGGHLIEQFWSPTLNRRDDSYGGAFGNRMRFSLEVIEAVAKAVSDDFIVGFRLSGNPLTSKLGLSADDMLKIARELDAVGRIDLFNISGGTGTTPKAQTAVVPYENYPRGCFNSLAQAMKEQLSKPVIAAGRNLDPEQAEQVLRDGECDFVAMTRAIIADPDLPERARRGEQDRIRPCTAINEGCIGRVYAGMPIACAVNPAIEDDRLETLTRPPEPRHVMVIGGGPAGMEAARVAAERGHRVTLHEASRQLGGQVRITARIPGRPHYALHVDWLAREINRLGVELKLQSSPLLEDILATNPDAVVLSTGSWSVCPTELCADDDRSVTDVDLLAESHMSIEGKRMLVYDIEGEHRGVGAANFASERGARFVEVTTPMFMVGEQLDLMERPALYRRLSGLGVEFSPGMRLLRQESGALVLRNEWNDAERSLDGFDYIVYAGYRVADTSLKAEIAAQAPNIELIEVGDRVAPRRLRDAVTEGVRAGRRI